MKTLHTPGPWWIVPRTAPKETILIESQNGLIAVMESSKTKPVTYEKAEANAPQSPKQLESRNDL